MSAPRSGPPARGRALARAAAAVLVALIGVGGGPSSAAQGGEAGPSAAAPGCRRVVTLAPNVVEVVFELGLGERVVGVGEHTSWPPEAAELPRLGGLYDPRLETIVALDPDLAVLLPSQAELAGSLTRLEIPVLTVPHETLEDLEVAIRRIADRCGVEAAGEELIADLRSGLAPREEPLDLDVLVVVGRTSGRIREVYAAGEGTFLGELVARLGLTNVAGPQPYPSLGPESIVAARPEVIVDLMPQALDAAHSAALAVDWRQLGSLPAVESGCLVALGGDHTLIPGPRLPRLYRELETAIDACAGEEP